MSLSVAYLQRSITPDLNRPIYLAGAQGNRRATGVRDNLTARVLSIKSAEHHLLLVTLDLFGLPHVHCAEVIERIHDYVGAGVAVLIACTGTLGGPDVVGAWGKTPTESGIDPDTLTNLKGSVILTAIEALRQPHQEVTLVGGRTKSGLDWQQFRLADGTPAVTVVIAPITRHEEADTLISAGELGALRQQIEAQTNAPSLALCAGWDKTPPIWNADDGHSMPPTNAHTSVKLNIPITQSAFRAAVLQGTLPQVIGTETALETSLGVLTLGAKRWLTLPLIAPVADLALPSICLVNDVLGRLSKADYLPSPNAEEQILKAAQHLWQS